MQISRNIPQHIAIIMDGNGRWARKRGLPKIAGHRRGVKTAQEIVKAAREFGIKALTLYTFSTENWKRPKKEVNALFAILKEYLDKEVSELNKNNIRFLAIGRLDGLPSAIRERLVKVMEATKCNTALTLNLALNYGARLEIVDAVRKIADDVKKGLVNIDEINEESVRKALYTKDLPDPDLLIRTSGEMRVSNFLLWQISYAEIYVTKKFWPDFTKEDLKKAVEEYTKRERRFGG